MYYLINANKLNRINAEEYICSKIPVLTKNDLIPDCLRDSKEAIYNIDNLIYLFEMNIKRGELGINQIIRISDIPKLI